MPDDLETLLPAIYDAALRPGQWPALMGRVGQVIEAHSSLLFETRPADGLRRFAASTHPAPGLLDAFLRLDQPPDPFASAAARKGFAKAGSVVLGDELLPRHELHRTRFFNELAAPLGIEAMLATVLFDGSEADDLPFTNLCWYREPGSDGFGSDHLQLVRRLLPHLQRALTIQPRLLSLPPGGRASGNDLGSPGLASFVLDRSGRIHQANAAARTLLAADGTGLLRFSAGRLQSLGDDCVPALPDALRRCRSGEPTTLLVRHRHAAGPLSNRLVSATLSALPRDAPTHVGAFAVERMLLLIKLPQDDSAALVARVSAVFGFTATEQKVITGLLEGLTVEEIAAGNGTTLNTVRTQVKSLLAKCGFTRQIDLVRTFSRLRD